MDDQKNSLSRLGLGSAQFGMNYGISNLSGQCQPSEIARILEGAWSAGMRVIDTAPTYGDSETTLGSSQPGESDYQFITKTEALASGVTGLNLRKTVTERFQQSCRDLKRERLYGFLVHHAPDLLGDQGDQLYQVLHDLKADGRVEKIGVSVYDPDEVDLALDRYELDLVQLPLNVLDQRMNVGGQLARLKAKGVEIHARSAFLQGLLLMEPDKLAPHFRPAQATLQVYREALESLGVSPLAAALNYVKKIAEVDLVLIGVTSHAELLEAIEAFLTPVELDYAAFSLTDETILKPQHWRLS